MYRNKASFAILRLIHEFRNFDWFGQVGFPPRLADGLDASDLCESRILEVGRNYELKSPPLRRMSLLPFNAVLAPNFSVVAWIGMKVVPHPPSTSSLSAANCRFSSVQSNFLRRFQSFPTFRDSNSADKISDVRHNVPKHNMLNLF